MGLPLAISAFEWLEGAIDGEAWTYPAIIAAVAFDSLLPVAPGEAVMITAGVLAANGDLSPVLVATAGTVGGCLGDNASYGLGRRWGVAPSVASSPRQGLASGSSGGAASSRSEAP